MKDELATKTLLAVIVWTFYEESHAVGMGFLQAIPDQKAKEAITAHALNSQVVNGTVTFDTDYLFGRMMKTTFKVSDNGSISVSHSDNPEYCSWLRIRETPSQRRKSLTGKAIEAATEGGLDEDFLSRVVGRNS